jgi:membrane fusion protein (multidrug efflux system)
MQTQGARYRPGFPLRTTLLCILHRMTAILLPALLCFAAGCSKAPEPQSKPRKVEVSVITIDPRDVPVHTEYIAQTQSSRQVNIQARVNGFVEKRVYTEGAMVREAETLFLMDKKPFKVQLDQAQASLAKQVAAMETARANLTRVKPLVELNALSQKDLDDATGQYQAYEAAVAQAKAQVEQAKLNLSYTVITSPVTGISSSAQQTDGTYISQQNSLLTTVAVLSPMWVNFSISENEMLTLNDQRNKGLLRIPKGNDFVVEVVLSDTESMIQALLIPKFAPFKVALTISESPARMRLGV